MSNPATVVEDAKTKWDEVVEYVTGPDLWMTIALGALQIVLILLVAFWSFV